MLANVSTEGVEALIERLDQAVTLPTAEAKTAAIKHVLSDLIRAGRIDLPARFRAPRDDGHVSRR